MGRIAIVTDSTADLPPELIQRHGITVVPLTVLFGDQEYRDGVDITSDEFLARLRTASALPTTAQPSAGLFEETYRRLAPDHDAILSVHISGRLSGTLGSAQIAAEAVTEAIPVHVVDSLNASLALGFQALRAAELAGAGVSAPVIAERLRAEVTANELVFFPETLTYLQRGGRIGKAQALLGSVLSLKPLLRVDEGQIVPYERTRTRARALTGLADFARGIDHPARLGILHCNDPDDAAALAAEIQPLTPDAEVIVSRMGSVILTHLGPGAMGVAVYAER